jgi:hypothetical protein
MSTQAPSDDWRAQALRNLEAAEQQPLNPEQATPQRAEGYWTGVAVKLVFLALLSVGLVYFGGWGFLAAPVFVAWLLFWPR